MKIFHLTPSVLALILSSLYLLRSCAAVALVDDDDAAASEPPRVNCRHPKNEFHPVCYCSDPSHWDSDICQESKKVFGPRPYIEKNLTEDTAAAAAAAAAAARESRIVGGDFVPVDSYPWFAALSYTKSQKYFCGGSLITPEFVLTAAHCVSDGILDDVIIGALKKNDANNGGQAPPEYRKHNRIIIHPHYKPRIAVNDFALIRLESRATTTPVALDQNKLSENYVVGKGNLWAIGFGTTSSGGPTSNHLKHVEVSYVPNPTCNEMYEGYIKGSMMCAADLGQDACQGDSGGPLFDSDSNTLVGIVSWGDGCADPNYPGVYARISNQWEDWIKPTICATHSEPKPDFCRGDDPLVPTPVSSPVAAPPQNTECYDSQSGWYDSGGRRYGCNSYYAEKDHCALDGDLFANPTFGGTTANQACCACGGGTAVSPCANPRHGLLVVTITTDEFSPDDNNFVVQKRIKKKRRRRKGQKVWRKSRLPETTTEIYTKCLPKRQCYQFALNDKYGDGLYSGGYTVEWMGTIIKESNFIDKKRETTPWFGQCS